MNEQNSSVFIYCTSPNQKCIITKKTKSGGEHLFGVINIQAAQTAAKDLSDRAFKLYFRMSLHQDGYTYALSPIEINNSIGLSANKYRSAVAELIEKGYMVQSQGDRRLYIFYEFPSVDCPNYQRRSVDSTDSEVSSIQNEGMTIPIQGDDLTDSIDVNHANSEGEILHDIINNNTIYNTVDKTDHNTIYNTVIVQSNEQNYEAVRNEWLRRKQEEYDVVGVYPRSHDGEICYDSTDEKGDTSSTDDEEDITHEDLEYAYSQDGRVFDYGDDGMPF